MKIQVQVEVQKEFMDLGVLLGGIVESVLEKKSAGDIASGAVGDLVKFLGEATAIPGDWSSDKAECLEGVILGLKSKIQFPPSAPAAAPAAPAASANPPSA
jgi:hypothetical protein